MNILFQKTSNTTHTLTIVRDNGTSERVELETKSYLKHDFVHFAIESCAQLHGGFWGRLAEGKTIQELNEREMFKPDTVPSTEAEFVEIVVGAFTGYVDRSRSPEDLLSGLKNLFDAYQLPVPSFVTKEMILSAHERLRTLLGEWNSLPFGEYMQIVWEEA